MPPQSQFDRTIATLAREVGEKTFHRGRRYADEGAVLELEYLPEDNAVVGLVAGGEVYRSSAFFDLVGDTLEFSDGACDCPVGYNCKHVVSLVLTLLEEVSRSHTAPASGWERILAAALDTGRQTRSDTVPLGLQVSLATAAQSRTGLKLTARVVRPGKTGWVSGDLSWSNLRYTRGINQHHARILQDLYALHQATVGNRYVYSEKSLDLAGFSRQLWPLLDEARDAGLELLYTRRALGKLPEPGSAQVEIDVTDTGTELTVTPRIRTDDAVGTPNILGFLGEPAHGVVYVPASDQTYTKPTDIPFRIARLQEPLAPAMLDLLIGGHTLSIPQADVPRFSANYLPRLRRTATVHSTDGSFTAPEVSGPLLRLDVDFRPAHRTDLRWQFVYTVGDTEHPVTLTPGPDQDFRDEAAEERILAGLDLPLARYGLCNTVDDRLLQEVTLHGLDTARFTTELLPLLENRDDVLVRVSGEPVEYREVSDALRIGLSTAATDSTDWFDLDVSLTVADTPLQFRDVFTALDSGATHLLLEDGSYLSLDKPELQRLRELINEAHKVRDDGSDRLQLSRFQAGLWEDLVALGTVERQAVQWRKQVQGLLDLRSTARTRAPKSLQATLRPYQLDGFRWLTFLWTHRLGGILADDMGLGKTLQSLALICHAQAKAPTDPPVLIVAPTSVVPNWETEAARFTPHLTVAAITQTTAKRGTPLAQAIEGADVVVTSYTLLRLDHDDYLARGWSMMLLDEAQFVKNHQSKSYQYARRVDAPLKVAITGTPMENNLMELWSLLSITAPGLFPNPTQFQDAYQRPIESGSAPELLPQLRRRIKPLMLRRTKEQVVAELPAKQDQVLEVDLAPKHRKLYDTALQRERRKILGLVDDLDRNRFTILQSLTLLRRLSLDAALVDEKHHAIPSAKIDALIDQLDDVIAGGHRALVFSQFTGFLQRVKARLDTAGIEYLYLDGRTRNRARVLEAFKTGTVPVFLISLKAGGFGLNLTEADYCFLLDPWWNPAAEAQAVDRTHRIGQTRNVMVYRLISRETIEDKVMALKARKSALFDAVVDDDGAFGTSLTADDIRELLN